MYIICYVYIHNIHTICYVYIYMHNNMYTYIHIYIDMCIVHTSRKMIFRGNTQNPCPHGTLFANVLFHFCHLLESCYKRMKRETPQKT